MFVESAPGTCLLTALAQRACVSRVRTLIYVGFVLKSSFPSLVSPRKISNNSYDEEDLRQPQFGGHNATNDKEAPPSSVSHHAPPSSLSSSKVNESNRSSTNPSSRSNSPWQGAGSPPHTPRLVASPSPRRSVSPYHRNALPQEETTEKPPRTLSAAMGSSKPRPGSSFLYRGAKPDGYGKEKAPSVRRWSPDDVMDFDDGNASSRAQDMAVNFQDWKDYSESDRLFGLKSESGSVGSSRSIPAEHRAEDATPGGFAPSGGAKPEGDNPPFAPVAFARSGGSISSSGASENTNPSSVRPSNSISYSLAPGISPASSHFAAKSEIENIRSLEKELHTLSTAILSYPKNSQTWLLLHSYLDRAREELDAILQDIKIHPHTIHVMAPSGNLGLVVDKPADGGPVYVRSLHPLSPLKDRVRLNDKIVAIDGEDVQQLSPVEVGKLLCRITDKEKRKISIVRDDVLFGYGSLDHAFNRSSHTCCTGISLEEMGSDVSEQNLSGFSEIQDLISVEGQELGSDKSWCLSGDGDLGMGSQSGSMEESDSNQSFVTESGSGSSDEEDEEMDSRVPPRNDANYLFNAKKKMDPKDAGPPPQSSVEIISSVKQYLKQLADDDLSSSTNHLYPELTITTSGDRDSALPELSGAPGRSDVEHFMMSSVAVEEEIKTWYADFLKKSSELKAMEKVSTKGKSTKSPKPMSASKRFKMKRQKRLEKAKAAERSTDGWSSSSNEVEHNLSQPTPISSDDEHEPSSLTSSQRKKLRESAARERLTQKLEERHCTPKGSGHPRVISAEGDDEHEPSSLTSGQWKKLRESAVQERRSHGQKFEI